MHEAKGEVLVLLTTRDIKAKEVREKLSAAGVPNLWIPKTIKRIDAIPLLSSGKLDLTRCEEIALGEAPAEVAAAGPADSSES